MSNLISYLKLLQQSHQFKIFKMTMIKPVVKMLIAMLLYLLKILHIFVGIDVGNTSCCSYYVCLDVVITSGWKPSFIFGVTTVIMLLNLVCYWEHDSSIFCF